MFLKVVRDKKKLTFYLIESKKFDINVYKKITIIYSILRKELVKEWITVRLVLTSCFSVLRGIGYENCTKMIFKVMSLSTFEKLNLLFLRINWNKYLYFPTVRETRLQFGSEFEVLRWGRRDRLARPWRKLGNWPYIKPVIATAATKPPPNENYNKSL